MTTPLYVTQLEEFMLESLVQSLNRDAALGMVYLHQQPYDAVWKEARSRLNERVQLRPVDDHAYLRAVLRAQACSLEVMETLWREIPAAEQFGRLLNRFFSDPHGEYALKKALVAEVESRLESIFTADALARSQNNPVLLVPSSPLDGPIVEAVRRTGNPPGLAIQVWKGQPYRRAFERRFARIGIRAALGTLLRLLRQPLQRRLLWRVPASRPYFGVAIHNKWTTGKLFGGRDDLFLVDDKQISRNDVLILCDGPQPDRVAHYRSAGVTALSWRSLPVPIYFLLGKVLPRVLRFVLAAGLVGLRFPGNPDLLRKVMQIITGEFDFEILLQHVSIGALLSDLEYSPSHVVRTLILNRYGGRTVRIPYSQVDRPGAALAYVHYDIFCSAGGYLPTTWGNSWSSRTDRRSVGQMFNRYENVPWKVAASEGAHELVTDLQKSGRRLVTVFTSSNTGVEWAVRQDWELFWKTLGCCLPLDDVVVLVKPKGAHTTLFDRPDIQERLGPYLASGRVRVLHKRWSTDCSAEFAMRHSVACVAPPDNSVVVEALCLGVPLRVPLLVPVHLTPFIRRFMGTVFFEGTEQFQQALRATLLGQNWAEPDAALVRDWFDPFSDGHAVDRIRNIVLSLNGRGK